jgi:alpha-D-xyloside xylohydrolase
VTPAVSTAELIPIRPSGECLVRWFQFSALSPVLRMHGDREPHGKPLSDKGGGLCTSGADNELWSFGDEVESILVAYLQLRERLRPYIRTQMQQAHQAGTPLMRPICYDFPDDKYAWQIEDEYMFGPDVLVAPVTVAGMRQRTIYLPDGCRWRNYPSGEIVDGGQTLVANAPLERIPMFVRHGSSVITLLEMPSAANG